VKIGPVVSAENRLTDGDCVVCSRGLARFSQSFHRMKAPYVQTMDLYLIFRYDKGRCHGNQIICEHQVRHGQKTGVFCKISPNVLDRFLQFFHRMKALYERMINPYFIFQFVKARCHSNQNNVERNEKVMKVD